MNTDRQIAEEVRCDHEDHVALAVVEDIGNRLRNAEALLRLARKYVPDVNDLARYIDDLIGGTDG